MQNKNSLRTLIKFWTYIKPYKYRTILAILTTLPLGSMDAAIAWFLKPFMDNILIERNASASMYVPVLIIIFSFVQSALQYSSTYLNAWISNKIMFDLKSALYVKMLRYDASFFDKLTSGDVQVRFHQDVNSACNGLLQNIRFFITRIITSISLIAVLIWTSWKLALVAILILVCALYPLSRVRKKLHNIIEKTVSSGSSLVTFYTEAFNGNRIISSYNLYEFFNKKFKVNLQEIFSLEMKMNRRISMLSPMMHFIVSIGIAWVLWMGSNLIISKELSPGGFISFITALLMLYQPLKSIGTTFGSIQTSLLAIDRIFEVLKIENNIVSTTKPLENFSKSIKFNNVAFKYEHQLKLTLSNINFAVNKGEKIAIIGSSGSGKSTILSLLLRFYDVTKGSIEIDNIDIKKFNIDSLRNNIAAVFQDTFIFSGTIKENILLGLDCSAKKLNTILKAAHIDEFISKMPDGIETVIGEKGIKLSGGQRQRIAIARALIKDAPIILLDEATASLDSKSELIINNAMENLMKDKTVFVVAHKLSTIENADKIMVMKHGKIAECGTHQDLIKNNKSLYYAFYHKILIHKENET